MTIRTSLLILFAAFLICLLELVIYFSTGMPKALSAPGLAMVAAYKFLWLMILTGAAGILAPVGASLENITGRKISGWAAWIVLVGFAMIGFTMLSFLGVSPTPGGSVESQPRTAASAPAPASQPSSPWKKIEEVIELVDSQVKLVEPEKVSVTLIFKNKSGRRIAEIYYAFALVDNGQVLLSINVQDTTSLPPPGIMGQSRLEWVKSNFKDPAEFEKLTQAVSKGGVKASVNLERVLLDDGTEVKA